MTQLLKILRVLHGAAELIHALQEPKAVLGDLASGVWYVDGLVFGRHRTPCFTADNSNCKWTSLARRINSASRPRAPYRVERRSATRST